MKKIILIAAIIAALILGAHHLLEEDKRDYQEVQALMEKLYGE